MSKSELERRFEQYCRIWELPPYQREYRFSDRKWRFDFAWPEKLVAVEIDGGQWKPGGGRHARDTDREKMNEAVKLRWRVLRFSGEMLNNPDRCMELVREVLDA